jgi:hypothetical protein
MLSLAESAQMKHEIIDLKVHLRNIFSAVVQSNVMQQMVAVLTSLFD